MYIKARFAGNSKLVFYTKCVPEQTKYDNSCYIVKCTEFSVIPLGITWGQNRPCSKGSVSSKTSYRIWKINLAGMQYTTMQYTRNATRHDHDMMNSSPALIACRFNLPGLAD